MWERNLRRRGLLCIKCFDWTDFMKIDSHSNSHSKNISIHKRTLKGKQLWFLVYSNLILIFIISYHPRQFRSVLSAYCIFFIDSKKENQFHNHNSMEKNSHSRSNSFFVDNIHQLAKIAISDI